VAGLSTSVTASNVESANDILAVEALAGDDSINASALATGIVKLTADGGADADKLLFNGTSANEAIDISANGERVRFFRDVANVAIDLNDVETLDLNTLGGSDTIVVGDLTGTDLKAVNLNLVGVLGGTSGDGLADSVIVNGTNGDDTIGISGSAATGVAVTGLPAAVNIKTPEAVNDSLTVNGLGGADTVEASALTANAIKFTANGGLGIDTITGSQGSDLVTGGDGNDSFNGGDGDDTFVWNPGDDNDTVEGQAGADTMLFNGANVSENIDISANGERVRFTRNVANIVMDLNDVEAITFNAQGGTDIIVVNDLTGTDLKTLNMNLGVLGGGGDGQPDTIILNGTGGDDAISIAGDASGVSVIGLAAQLNITGAESANDWLTVGTLAGDDTVDASGLASGAIQLTADGGEGADVLVGGAGVDVLSGGAGDDVLLGGPGLDVLDGGEGNNILIQD
jgi:predicted ester cyclase